MDVLVESHDGGQLARALELSTPLIGINNRDLRSFETRLETTLSLISQVPPDRLLITESGITSRADFDRLWKAKVSAYLVGSAFMAAESPARSSRGFFRRHKAVWYQHNKRPSLLRDWRKTP
jgi:indole-3-glycerol phosphate synthase